MESVLISLLILVVVVVMALWLIGILPVPEVVNGKPFPFKTILYIIVILAAIFYLLRFLR